MDPFIWKNLPDEIGHIILQIVHGKQEKASIKLQRWFRWQRFVNKFQDLFEKVLLLPANHDSVLGYMYPDGGDLYKEIEKKFQSLLIQRL